MPGDRAFPGAVRTADEVMMPVVREARRTRADRDDVVWLLIGRTSVAGSAIIASLRLAARVLFQA